MAPEHIFPIIYANLDPDLTPSPQNMESPSSTTITEITRAFFALQVFSTACRRATLSDEVAAEIWPRIWGWISFVDFYRDYDNPALRNVSQPQVYSTLIQAICEFCFPVGMIRGKLVTDTPGWRTFITRAWSVFVAEGDFTRETQFHNLCTIMVRDMQAAHPTNFRELIDGVGGNVDDLAALVIQHLKLLLTYLDVAQTTSIRVMLGGPFQLLIDTDGKQPEFWHAILKQGIITVLTTAICRFAVDARLGDPLGSCLRLLVSMTGRPLDSFRWMTEALKSGLMKAVLLCCTSNIDGVPPQTEYFLQEAIPRALVSYSAVVQVERALADGFPLASLPSFRASPLVYAWDRLAILATERIKVMKDYSGGGYATLRVCDNIKCAKVTAKHGIKQCSACEMVYYCSWACQYVDWRDGGHRHDCKIYTAAGPRKPEHLSARERSFMCALLQSDYRAQRHTILLHKIAFMYERPGGTFCMTSLPTSPHTLCNSRRAARSDPRTEIIMMMITEGVTTRVRAVSVRFRKSNIYYALRRIVDRIPAGLGILDISQVETHFGAQVRALREDDEPVFSLYAE
ncbi:hypothetical protein B0H17DRAFT_1206897 [Mycena rosella]|uniref:MYND-type domain-containing protein n=1 Tax=Mycena rosella TaxID=1033263 RepID=A0AAD7GCE4_MYCRO|nr:hypothetical protein B0H17DRAFT_1206897 [Mycena rosella]